MKKQFKTIDEYIEAFPEDVQKILQRMRQTIRKAAPEAAEAISYQMPTFELDNKNLVHLQRSKTMSDFIQFPRALQHSKRNYRRTKQERARRASP